MGMSGDRANALPHAAVSTPMKIPSEVRSFKNKTGRSYVKNYAGLLPYEPEKGEHIDVRYWHRWPSYDFIFGVPDPRNPNYNQEAAYFVYRDTRTKKVKCGFYVDTRELEVLAQGFKELLRIHRLRLARLPRRRG